MTPASLTLLFLSLSLLHHPPLVTAQTEQFVHALNDEMVKSALLALHAARPGFVSQTPGKGHAQAGQHHHHQQHQHHHPSQDSSPSAGSPAPKKQLPGHSPSVVIGPASVESPVVCNNNVTEPRGVEDGEGGGGPKKQDSIPHHNEYDEEEWASGIGCCFCDVICPLVSLFCVLDMVTLICCELLPLWRKETFEYVLLKSGLNTNI